MQSKYVYPDTAIITNRAEETFILRPGDRIEIVNNEFAQTDDDDFEVVVCDHYRVTVRLERVVTGEQVNLPTDEPQQYTPEELIAMVKESASSTPFKGFFQNGDTLIERRSVTIT